MRHRRSIRLAAAGLVLPALAVAFLIPGSAASAGSKPKPVKGSCSSMSGTVATTITLSGCTPSPEVTPTGTFSGFGQGNTDGAATLTWTNGNVTHIHYKAKGATQTVTKTKKGVTSTVPNPKYHCPNYADQQGIQAVVKAKITSQVEAQGTGLKGSVKATVCLDGLTGPISLRPGTVFAL